MGHQNKASIYDTTNIFSYFFNLIMQTIQSLQNLLVPLLLPMVDQCENIYYWYEVI